MESIHDIVLKNLTDLAAVTWEEGDFVVTESPLDAFNGTKYGVQSLAEWSVFSASAMSSYTVRVAFDEDGTPKYFYAIGRHSIYQVGPLTEDALRAALKQCYRDAPPLLPIFTSSPTRDSSPGMI